MEPKELLRVLMERDGDNPNSLAAKLSQKTKQPQIYKFLEGIAKEPRRSTLQPVADHYGISVEAFYDKNIAASVLAELLSDKAAIPSSRPAAQQTSNVTPGPDIRGRVPLISWVQAGAWCGVEDLVSPREAERWFDCPVNHSVSTFALRVRGDSMTAPHGNARTYPEGCFIFVDPEKRQPDNGDRVVARLDGSDEVTFKVYKNEDGRQWLQPLNPSHEPIRERFKVLGTVLGKWEDG